MNGGGIPKRGCTRKIKVGKDVKEFTPGQFWQQQGAQAEGWEAYQDPVEGNYWMGQWGATTEWSGANEITPPRFAKKSQDENASPNVMQILLQENMEKSSGEKVISH